MVMGVVKTFFKDEIKISYWGLSGKEPACNAGAVGDMGSIPDSERFPGNPLQYSCLENLMDREAWCESIALQRVRHIWSDLVHLQKCIIEQFSENLILYIGAYPDIYLRYFPKVKS